VQTQVTGLNQVDNISNLLLHVIYPQRIHLFVSHMYTMTIVYALIFWATAYELFSKDNSKYWGFSWKYYITTVWSWKAAWYIHIKQGKNFKKIFFAHWISSVINTTMEFRWIISNQKVTIHLISIFAVYFFITNNVVYLVLGIY
jgi:hypothetical protein